jgi:hypothetical protein
MIAILSMPRFLARPITATISSGEGVRCGVHVEIDRALDGITGSERRLREGH